MKIMKYSILACILLLLLACQNNTDKQGEDAQPIDQLTDLAESEVVTASQKSEGEKLFLLCAACHSLKKEEPHKVGPNLHQVFGSTAASKEGFTYSEALKKSNIVWDTETMRQWIENPTDMIAGTSMAFIGIKETQKQDALITYIKKMTE